jgi:hypothetical protein
MKKIRCTPPTGRSRFAVHSLRTSIAVGNGHFLNTGTPTRFRGFVERRGANRQQLRVGKFNDRRKVRKREERMKEVP